MAPAKEDLYKVETNILPISKLIVVFSGIALCLLISFIDQNSIGLGKKEHLIRPDIHKYNILIKAIALPTIGKDLDASTTISWAGTSSLIANTCFQVLYGRLSDIFGRKGVFLSCVLLLGVGDLACGFAQTGPQLYGFRAISGVAAGGIGALTMMIVSDIVTLENRGKYQGILGSCIGLGNVIGPFLAAIFIEKSTWRGLFWLLAPCTVVAAVVIFFILPKSIVVGDPKGKIKAIDFAGVGLSTTAVLLILIPVSGGGTYFQWNSPMVISMLVVGSLAAVAFIIVEWKFAKMPMMPLHLYRIPAVGAILVQNFLFGIVYQSNLYYLPLYFQIVEGYSPIESAALLVPFVAMQSIISTSAGWYISTTKRYGEVIWTGYTLWTLGAGLTLTFARDFAIWKIVLILAVEGSGVGMIFQPTLVAAQAHSKKSDRAVVIAVRNFLRSFGGAVGLALSAAVYSNSLKNHLLNASITLPSTVTTTILGSILSVPDTSSLNASQADEVLDAYMAASKSVFYIWAPLMACCLVLCVLIKDKGLARAEEKVEKTSTESEAKRISITEPTHKSMADVDVENQREQ